MKLTKLFITFYSLIFCLLIVLGIIAFIMLDNQAKLNEIQELRLRSYMIASELKESSEDLTRFARTYVLTGDSVWENKYWETIEVRKGKRSRGNGSKISLSDSLYSLPLLNSECDKLKEAENNSNTLVLTERAAFYALKGMYDDGTKTFQIKGKPNKDFAQRLLFNDQYILSKEKIMKPIADFLIMVDKRVQKNSKELNDRSYEVVILIIFVIFLIMVIVILSFYILKNKIIKKLEELRYAYSVIEDSQAELSTQNEELKDIKNVLEQRNIELIESEEKLKSLINIADVGIFISDVGGNQIIVNNWWKDKLGYEKSEITIAKISNIIYTEDSENIIDLYTELVSSNFNRYNIESKFTKKDGKICHGRLSVAAIRDNGNNIISIIGILVDVTAIRKSAEKIELQNKQLSEINAVKDRFISILAHDLRSPFNSLIGLSSILLEDMEEYDKEKIKYYIEIINSTSNNTYAFLEELLEWSKSQQDKTNFSPMNINVGELVSECVELLNHQAIAKIIEISVNIPLSITAFADEDMLKTILRNLITNAIKYSVPSGKIEISSFINGNQVEISVKDNGIGMDNKTLESLFKIGESRTKTGTAGERGSGFGLLLCDEFIKKMSGKVWVESELGKGSNFRFTLPLAKP